jgi:CubicO group peptidase (beta-lactamase class C family)
VSRLIGRVLLGLCLAAVAVVVADPVSRPAWSAPPDCRSLTQDAVADYFDRAVPGRLAKDRVPGTVVSVVSGSQMVFRRGYGLADLERRTPFDPDRSLVRIASITKLFTATAVLQQVEAGRLDLDADVNTYLKDFRIPATYPEPVTLRTLLNHTAGFEDLIIGTGARRAADVQPLGRYLAEHMPARIRPPGEISAYSNYGAALAGYVVTQVTGESYADYVGGRLLAPLGMTHSTAAEPVPAALADDLARSYASDERPPRRVPFTFDQLTPDGSVSATASDLAHFMIAQLNQGRYAGRAILAPATVAAMQTRSFAADPRLGGYAHGFMERYLNGRRVLMHDGGWEAFQSALLLVPGCRLGLFVSANGTTGTESLGELVDGFLDRFAPTPAVPEAPTAPESSASTAVPTAGFYTPTRRNTSSVEKLLTLLGPMRLTVADNGTVHFKGKDWTPQGGGLYRSDDDHLVFLTNQRGVRYVATDGPAYQLMSRAEALPVNLGVLLGFALAAVSALAVPVAAAWRRTRRRQTPTTTRWRASRGLAAGAAVLGLGFLVALAVQLFGDTSAFLYGVPVGFRLLLCLPVVVLALSAAAVGCTVAGWRGSGAGLLARVHQVLLISGLSALAWFFWQWNLIGWQFG